MSVPNETVTDVLARSRARVEAMGPNPRLCIVCLTDQRFPNVTYSIRMEPRFSLLGSHKNTFYVDNVTLKCPRCKLLLTFGVPIPQAEYEEELALRKKLGLGKSISAEMNDDRTRERLISLGYLGARDD